MRYDATMQPNLPPQWDDPAGWPADDWPAEAPDELEAAERHAPSLPIILFSAAGGIAGGVVALFAATRWFHLGLELSAAVATLGMLFSLGISGAVLSAITGSRAAPVNILFSCGLILLTLLFLALCLLAGALAGVVMVSL